MRWLTRLVSVTVILLVVAGAVLLVRAKLPRPHVAGKFLTYAKFRDGARLAVGSPVVIAGVQVGVIEKLSVAGSLARIDMRLQDGLELTADSFATRRADSLFGDSYIEIILGAPDARRLASGEPITHIVEGGSTDALLRGIDTALPRIDNALNTVHDAVITGRTWVSGSLDNKLGGTLTWLDEGNIERPLASAQHAMIRLDEMTVRGAEAVANAAPGVFRTLDGIDRAVVNARTQMRNVKTGLADALQGTREGLDRVDEPIANAAELMTAINEGRGDDWKGTLGRLVNDPGLGETLEDVTESGRDAVGSFNRFKTWLGMRVEYNVYSGDTRFYATAEVHARTDKFYLIEAERGPLGAVPADELADVVGQEDFTRTQSIADRLRFTAQFGKVLGRFAVRGGLKDSTFGAGIDALMLDGRLKLSTDVYGSFQRTPRVKVTGALAVFRSMYVLAGVDDALNTPGYLRIVSGNTQVPRQFDHVRYGRDYFLGATLVVNDADISVLLRVYGALLVGLL